MTISKSDSPIIIEGENEANSDDEFSLSRPSHNDSVIEQASHCEESHSPDNHSQVNNSEAVDSKEKDMFVVGIGASAGGLNACRKLLRNIETSMGCFVLCQHLSPSHESKLTEILSRETNLSVRQIEHRDKVKAGYFYIAPPNADIEIKNDTLFLSEPQSGPFAKPNISKFFASLALNSGDHAIAVILSGTGSDGAKGVTAIRAGGGIVLAQDPGGADYDGMPNASIATHVVDLVGTSESLGQHLTKIITDSDSQPALDLETDAGRSSYDAILSIVFHETKVNFAKYKKNTISRRIQRRMAIRGIRSFDDYLKYIQTNKAEVWAFAKDAFIVVSEFYRDVEQFDAFKQRLVTLIEGKGEPKQLRIWIPGCATGEEPYTVAMILEDIKTEHKLVFDYKILATDISDKAINFARKACYPVDKLRNVPDTWLKLYFRDSDHDSYLVSRHIRDRVVFSVHNVFSDPPFSKLDVISCRNLLIYFDSSLQADITKVFHYSLSQNGGVLFVGNSEHISDDELFKQADSQEKIFYKNINIPTKAVIPDYYRKNNEVYPDARSHRKSDIDREKVILQAMGVSYAPVAIVINHNNAMVYAHGDYLNLLSSKGGLVNTDIFEMIQPQLKPECRALLYRCRQSGSECVGSHQYISVNGNNVSIKLSVRPLKSDIDELYCISYLIVNDVEHSEFEIDKSNSAMLEMEHELNATRENLQTVIEELESANEQLQVYNEELQSSNEEYQSTNEELQTVNEELQSTNEELITINEEYSLKTAEQSRLSSDLTNIQESLDIPFILITPELRIQRYTRSCSLLFNTRLIKIGDLFFAIDWRTPIPDLRPFIDQAKRTLERQNLHLEISGRTFHCQISPYINGAGEFDGYTLIFYDTTDFEAAQNQLNVEKLQAQTTLDLVLEGVVRVDSNAVVEFANPAAIELLERGQDDLSGHPLTKHLIILDEQENLIDLETLVLQCVSGLETYKSEDTLLVLKTRYGKSLHVELSIVPIVYEKKTRGCVLTIRDVSEKQMQLERLRWQSMHDSLTGLVNRNEMDKRLESCILACKRGGHESSLLYIDLDQFKVINDTCGHLAGDSLLTQVSQIMSEMLRSRDTLARLGGDEFGVLLDHCQLAEAEGIAYKILAKIRDYRFAWDDKIFRVGASIGVVSINQNICKISEVLSEADAACYAAKEQGRNCIQVHSRDNKLLETQRLQMRSISDISEAIENNSFRLYFHQIRDVKSERVTAWEVLIRMFNKKGEFLLPGSFLPAAERFGLINRIDCWVVEQTFNQIGQYYSKNEASDFPSMCINLSAHTVTDDTYLHLISDLVKEHKIPQNKVAFEITETAAVSNMHKAKKFMDSAKSLGFKFFLDDFGTGMSSLSYLKELPVDGLKIDMSFVKNITNDLVNQEIVRAAKSVSHLLNLDVVAEGIETRDQLECIRNLGVDHFQGFLHGKPIPFEEFVKFGQDQSGA